ILQGSGVETCIINGGESNIGWPNHTVIMVDSVIVCKISGFSITYQGYGITVINSRSVIENTIIDSCHTGIFCRYSSEIKMVNNQILNSSFVGIGILDTSKVILLSNIISNSIGPGIEIVNHSQAEIINNLIYHNGWHSLRVAHHSKAVVYNTIIWYNFSGIADDTDSDSLIINYSDIQPDLFGNIWEGIGNIGVDPLFKNTSSYDFYLRENSPCIDTGNPDPIFYDVDGSRNDMGAFGGPYGSWLVSGVTKKQKNNLPDVFVLSQNFPNPFNSETTISFNLFCSGHLELRIFNLLGTNLKTLLDNHKSPGYYVMHWDGCDRSGNQVPSGVYICRAKFTSHNTNSYNMKKMILVR
ncbi:right-handed parallel beta-helix repeat-containing protein, partial [candidate division KSB1 bacterium]|nr:right-handed parallel beta-helix repeat-containing protein [candidate division KSB1 bacterium]